MLSRKPYTANEEEEPGVDIVEEEKAETTPRGGMIRVSLPVMTPSIAEKKNSTECKREDQQDMHCFYCVEIGHSKAECLVKRKVDMQRDKLSGQGGSEGSYGLEETGRNGQKLPTNTPSNSE